MQPNIVDTIGRAVAASILCAVMAGCGGGSGPTLTVRPPVPTTLTITSGDNQSGTVAQALPNLLVVKVSDQAGKPFAGATVTWTVTSGGGAVDHASTVSGEDGTASTRGLPREERSQRI
jgi:hypothetical protein